MTRFPFIRLLCLACALVLLAGCASTPKPKPARPVHGANPPVVNYALSLQGTPYVWGGESMAEGGFDCSGFVQHVYRQYGILLPRTAHEMAETLPPLDERSKQPGDLVFFNTTGTPYSHVGIYIGHNDFVHSSSAKGGVIISSLDKSYWVDHFLGIRRPGALARRPGPAAYP